jgi:hypothetical protein
MSMTTPKVTVLMPVHNGAAYLRDAVVSVLNQTFTDFEFIIVDDGSTDETPDILAAFDDPRIVVVRNPTNLGLVASLNLGIDRARGEYIARMDADDICMRGRLWAQVRYLDRHPEVGLLGTGFVRIDAQGVVLSPFWLVPSDEVPGTLAYLRWSLLWRTSVQHPTAMIRRSALGEMRYEADYFTAEDYELWARMGHVTGVARLPGAYLSYRTNPAGVSVTKQQKQLETHFAITLREISRFLGSAPNPETLRVLFQLVIPHPPEMQVPADRAALDRAIRLLLHIERAYLRQHRLLPRERAGVRGEVRAVLFKAWAQARATGDPALQGWALMILLRHMPQAFFKRAAQFVYYRGLKPLTKRLKRSG